MPFTDTPQAGELMGRVSKEQATKNRQKVVEGAARLFQRHGLKGAAIADLMADAGLTHGGFYRQFASKEAIAGEACTYAMRRAATTWQATIAREPPENAVPAIVQAYLAANAATPRCPMPALAADVAREEPGSPVRQAFTDGVADLAGVLASCIPAKDTEDASPPRDRALALLAAMVGAVALCRAIDDTALADEIMDALRDLAAGS